MDTEINYIEENVEDLEVSERRDILQMLVNSGFEESRIITKGGGVMIKFAHISPELIRNIHSYVRKCILQKKKALEQFPAQDA